MNQIAIDHRGAPAGPMSNRAVLAWASVVIAALLSFYVHVLKEQVVRGEQFREQLRQGPGIALKAPRRLTQAPGLHVARADADS